MIPAMMPVQQQAKPLAAFSSASFFLFVLLLTAANLRAPITAVGPVLQDTRQTFGLSASEAGLFNFIPLMLFALLAPPCRLAGKSGRAGTQFVGRTVPDYCRFTIALAAR